MDNKEILEKISDLCKPLTPEQREYLTENLTVYTCLLYTSDAADD